MATPEEDEKLKEFVQVAIAPIRLTKLNRAVEKARVVFTRELRDNG